MICDIAYRRDVYLCNKSLKRDNKKESNETKKKCEITRKN